MFRIILLIATFGLFTTFYSCTNCKDCRIVKTNTETEEVISEGTPEQYCDEDLEATENEEPVVYENEKTEWICE